MLLRIFKVVGHSMEPKIKYGDTILVSNIFYLFKKPTIGDIVALKEKDKIFIKRITKVIKEKYFLEGDNKKDSLDSNQFGLFSRQQILGKVFF